MPTHKLTRNSTDADSPPQTLALTLRLLAGYSFVGSRLKSSVVYFETDERKPRSEMGLTRLGYERRGDMWIKPEEITRRDFLIW